jgi:hypothetical protein
MQGALPVLFHDESKKINRVNIRKDLRVFVIIRA